MDNFERAEELITQAHAQGKGFKATLESEQIIEARPGFLVSKSAVTVFDENSEKQTEILFTQIREIVLTEKFSDGPFDPGKVFPSGTESMSYC